MEGHKIDARSGTQPDGSSHLGPGQLHPYLLPGANGAQTRRVSVPIGSQLIGTAQTKRVRLRYGSHISHGNEIIFIDPHKGIHDDENNVCLWRSTSFVISATCPVCCE